MENSSTALPDKEKLAQEAEYAKVRAVQEASAKRMKDIATAIIAVFEKNEVLISELPQINSIIDEKVNVAVRGKSIKELLKK